MNSFRDWLVLNEVFDYISNYKEVSKDVYIENWINMLKKHNPNSLKRKGIDLERTVFDNHGPRVHYYTYDNYLIFYGKFKSSNKYEVHFWDIKNLEYENNVGKSGFNKIFSIIMSILKDKHLKTNARLYMKHDIKERREFYQKIITKIFKDKNINWKCEIIGENVIIYPGEDELKESSSKIMFPNTY